MGANAWDLLLMVTELLGLPASGKSFLLLNTSAIKGFGDCRIEQIACGMSVNKIVASLISAVKNPILVCSILLAIRYVKPRNYLRHIKVCMVFFGRLYSQQLWSKEGVAVIVDEGVIQGLWGVIYDIENKSNKRRIAQSVLKYLPMRLSRIAYVSINKPRHIKSLMGRDKVTRLSADFKVYGWDAYDNARMSMSIVLSLLKSQSYEVTLIRNAYQ